MRALRVALLQGKCVEVKSATDPLIERSSLLEGLEEGTTATVAFILLPIHMQSHQHRTLERFVEMARKRAETNGSTKLQIVCARKVLDAERATAKEEEERAQDSQILLSLPDGSCAIPSSERKRRQILTCCCDYLCVHDHLSFFMANVGSDMEGRKIFDKFEFIEEREISSNAVVEGVPEPEPEPEISRNVPPWNAKKNSIQNFIRFLYFGHLSSPAQNRLRGHRERTTTEFFEALKGNDIHYLLIDNHRRKLVVDDLHGKAIGFLICHFKFLECIKLQQIYKDLQQKDSNFIWIWVPTRLSKDCGHGSYTRLIQCMPWATFSHPPLVNVFYKDSYFVVVDKHGQTANHDALPLLLGWGVKSYPFTHHTIPESLSLVESESCLEFLLHGTSIGGRKQMKSKMIFLYAQRPRECHRMESKFEELIQIHGSFIYVGYPNQHYSMDISNNTLNLKQEYEDAIQTMPWPSLSFSDMIMFWYRCEYLASMKVDDLKEEFKTLRGLAKQFWKAETSLVLMDKDGAVTRGGYDVVQMICESDETSDGEGMAMVKDELMKSLSSGECSPMVKRFFRDEIHNLPTHPQHPTYLKETSTGWCDICGACILPQQRSYRCGKCNWDMCGSCWMAYAKQEVEQLLPDKDN